MTLWVKGTEAHCWGTSWYEVWVSVGEDGRCHSVEALPPTSRNPSEQLERCVTY